MGLVSLEFAAGMKPKGALPSKTGRHVDHNWEALSRGNLSWVGENQVKSWIRSPQTLIVVH